MDLNWRQTNDGDVVIAVDGELDLLTAPELREQLLRAITREPAGQTTIDFGECTFVDSTAIGVVVEVGALLEEGTRELRLANLRDQPKQVFDLTLVDRAPFIRVMEAV